MTGIAEDQFPMDRFDIFNVRAEGYDQRLPMLETAVRHYHPDLVILDGIPYLCSEEQLKEALFQAQKKVAEDRQSTTKTLAPFNPKYVKGKEGRKTLFDLPSLFKAVMDDGVEYDDGNLRTKLSLESNIVTDHVLSEQIQRAIADGIILESRSALNGKKIYMLHAQPMLF